MEEPLPCLLLPVPIFGYTGLCEDEISCQILLLVTLLFFSTALVSTLIVYMLSLFLSFLMALIILHSNLLVLLLLSHKLMLIMNLLLFTLNYYKSLCSCGGVQQPMSHFHKWSLAEHIKQLSLVFFFVELGHNIILSNNLNFSYLMFQFEKHYIV